MFLVMFVWSVVICILPHLFVFISFLFFNLSFLFTCFSLADLSFVVFFVLSLFKQCVNLELLVLSFRSCWLYTITS